MSDNESEEDFKKFTEDDNDQVKPIDMDAPQASAPAAPPPAGRPAPRAEDDPANNPPPLPEAPAAEEQAAKPASAAEPETEIPDSVPEEVRMRVESEGIRYAKVGEHIDIKEHNQSLRDVYVGAGWEQRKFDGDKVDVDLSVFLLDREDKTRVDEDFIFYNNTTALDGAIKHLGDSRTGAGEGDDEGVNIDLNGVPFDVLKVVFTLSVYTEAGDEGPFLHEIRDLFIRFVDKGSDNDEQDERELFRYVISEDVLRHKKGMIALILNREGPQWFAEPIDKTSEEGLPDYARTYGIIVKEDVT